MAGLTTRDLSRLVLDPDFKIATADLVEPATLDAAIDELQSVTPLFEQDPGLTSEAAQRIDRLLRPIGAKIDPRINDEQASAWRHAMVLALSDLPARIAEYATMKAVHRPMQFLNEVETNIREIAEDAAQKQRTALARLKRWREAVDRATNAQPALAAEPEQWTQEEVDQANRSFAKLGLKTRYRIGENGIENYEISAEEREIELGENSQN